MPRCGLRWSSSQQHSLELAQLDFLRNWKETETYKIDVLLLPKELDEKVAELHFQVLSTKFFLPVVTWISPGVPSAGFTRHKKSTLRAYQMAQCGDDPAGEKSTPAAYERVISVVTDQGTEKWLLTFRWMLWLAPAGLRGGLKLEAYLQSRQPLSFLLCVPRCSGTSDRCSGRCGVIF